MSGSENIKNAVPAAPGLREGAPKGEGIKRRKPNLLSLTVQNLLEGIVAIVRNVTTFGRFTLNFSVNCHPIPNLSHSLLVCGWS